MRRPQGQHLRLAERRAYEAGAQAVEWRHGSRHLRMLITLPHGRLINYAISRRMTAWSAAHLEDWIVQRIRKALREDKP